MSVSGIIALIACLASVLAKVIFTIHSNRLERIQEMENNNYQTAKNELHASMQKQKRLEAEKKQLESRLKATERSIKNIESTLKDLQTRKKEDDAIRAYQKEMIKGKPK